MVDDFDTSCTVKWCQMDLFSNIQQPRHLWPSKLAMPRKKCWYNKNTSVCGPHSKQKNKVYDVAFKPQLHSLEPRGRCHGHSPPAEFTWKSGEDWTRCKGQDTQLSWQLRVPVLGSPGARTKQWRIKPSLGFWPSEICYPSKIVVI